MINFLNTLSIKKLLIISFFLHLCGAYFSEGHHKLDEYDGILINVGYLLNYFDETWLSPGETSAQIRAWIQPFLYTGILSPLKLMGIENPFTQTFFMRLFSSLIGFTSIFYLSKSIHKIFNESYYQKLASLWLCLLWFIPFFHARTTAENLSISFFIFAFSLIVDKTPENIWKQDRLKLVLRNKTIDIGFISSLSVGLLFGICFLFRYQMAMMIFFFCLWFLLFTRLKILNLFLITISCCLVIGLGSIIDFYGYGNWTFAPWNNWDYNVNKGVAASIGVDPWYKYFEKTLLKGIPPVSLLFLFSYLYLWFKRPGNWLTWVSLPFVIIHSSIAHKELRFIFGLGLFLPFAIVYLEQRFQFFKKFPKIYATVLFVNLMALLVASFSPAYSAIDLYKTIYHHRPSKIYVNGDFPKPLNYYFPEKSMTLIKDLRKIDKSPYWLFTNKYNLHQEIMKNRRCEQIYANYPEWLLNRIPEKRRKRSKVFFLYKCSIN